jgi:hypothetical protein
MNTRTAALVFGIVFLIAGVAGFAPAPPPADAPPLTIQHGHGLALGMFPVNTPHTIIHLLFGVLGLAAYFGAWSSRSYFRMTGVAYLLLAVLGLNSATNTTFGLVPIWGADVFLHAGLGLVASYFGFVASSTAVSHSTARPHHA